MKHLVSASIITLMATTPAMADFTAQRSELKSSDVTASYKLGKIAKTPSTRAENEDPEWKSLGIGKYRDDVFSIFGLPSESWNVEIMESANTPGCYKVVNPYGSEECPYFAGNAFEGADLVIHAEDPDLVYMEYTELKGVMISDTDEEGNQVSYQTYLCDIGGYFTDMYADWGMGPEDLAGMGIPFGTLKNGSIKFEANAMLLDLPEIDEQYYVNASGLFRISLPGAPDYDLTLSMDENDLDKGVLNIGYSAGKDVASVKYLIADGWKKDCISSMREQLLQEVADNGLTASDGVIEATVPFGVHSLVAVSFDAEGQPAESVIKTCYGRTDDTANWKPLGKCEYSEAFLRHTYTNMECDPYEVEIEESVKKPGVYRLVDPYGEIYPKYSFLKEEMCISGHEGPHFLIVDASDPDRVMIEASPIGVDAGDGEAQLFSVSWYMVQCGADPDDEEVVLDYGKLADGRITFPGGAIATYEEWYGITRGNLEHTFLIKLPDTTGVTSIGTADEAEYFTTSGLKADRPTKAGIYIRRNGGNAEKIIVR